MAVLQFWGTSFSPRKIEHLDCVALGDRAAQMMWQFMKQFLHTFDMPEIAAFPEPDAGLDIASDHEPVGEFLQQPPPLGPDPTLYVADPLSDQGLPISGGGVALMSPFSHKRTLGRQPIQACPRSYFGIT